MANPNNYVCLSCGSTNGTPAENNNQTWYWLDGRWGRIGPFCRKDHRSDFRIHSKDVSAFTLEEIRQLEFVRSRMTEDDTREAFRFKTECLSRREDEQGNPVMNGAHPIFDCMVSFTEVQR